MEGQLENKSHRLQMNHRHTLAMTGITDVVSFDGDEIILETVCGLLLIKGQQLHLNQLNLEKGEVSIDGSVDSLTYSDSGKGGKQGEGLFSRLFK